MRIDLNKLITEISNTFTDDETTDILNIIKECEEPTSSSGGSVSCTAHRPDEWKNEAIKLAKIIVELNEETPLDIPLSDFQEIERIASVR